VKRPSITAFIRRTPLAGPARSLYRRFWPLSPAEMNARYDHETAEVMARVLTPESTCLDIGAHAGGILRVMLRHAPRGRHVAFEPLPNFAAQLRSAFPEVQVREIALADTSGPHTFEYVVSNPGLSGLRRRTYERPDEEIRTITVQTARLDDVVPAPQPVALVKVDVEGAELQVFRGGVATLTRCRPFIIFEHGQGAADHYGTTPGQVYDLLVEHCNLRVNLMRRWLVGRSPFSRSDFIGHYERGQEFYYLAHP
jgi:FkbM family methyltransferase